MTTKCLPFCLLLQLLTGFVLWNFIECAMQCDDPPSIFNGYYTYNVINKTGVTIGTQAIYSCNLGYELRDPSVSNLTCILNKEGEETIWAGEIPACQAMISCSDPGFSMNGLREGQCCLPGDIVSYLCNEGFEIVGEKNIECLSSSQWSSPRPLCRPLKKHCELPPEVLNGAVLLKSGDYALANEEAEIICKPGFKFNGTTEFPYCNGSGYWEEEFGECVEILCNRPEPLANGNIPELENSGFNDTFPYNFVITYDCNEGYILKKRDPFAVCGRDGWSVSDPRCEEIFCPDPGVPEYGSREGNSFKVGARVHFKCSTGYDLVGSFERYCKPNGKWSGELARCNAPTNHCPNPGTPINGMKYEENYDEGDKVKFSCKPGFMHSGTKERTCMADGTWNGIETLCLGPYDYDNSEEIGNNLKNRLNEQFDEELKKYQKYLSAYGLTGMDGRTLDVYSNGRLIVYFVFDVSGSITKPNFKKGIEFAKAIVKKIGISEDGARAGAMVFSSEPTNIFFPIDYSSMEDVLDHLDSIEYLGGGTATSFALQRMKDNVLLAEKFFEENTKKSVLFLITDGKTNMGGSPEYEAENLKEMGVEIFCIGITGDVKADSLYQIASISEYNYEMRPNVFILKNYERLSWLIDDITTGTIDYSQCGVGMESKMSSNVGRMIGGEESPEPWPWMAALFFRDLKRRERKPELLCGGSVINEKFILTGATCLFRFGPRNYHRRSVEEIIVKLGLVELMNETVVQEFQVETIYIHKDYSPGSNYDNNIALLKLDGSITYNPFLRPVCLPPEEDDNNPLYQPGEIGWVTGWGHERKMKPTDINTHYRLSKQLKELRMPIQSMESCKSSLPGRKNVFTERMFCAGDGISGNDTCKGDSGGPLMQPHLNSEGQLYWTQVGIVSWGIGCGLRGHYAFFTNVQSFMPWIDEKIKESALDEEAE